MATTVVLRAETLTAGGDIAGANTSYLVGTVTIPPEDPSRAITTEGSASVSGLGSISWESSSPIVASSGSNRTYRVGYTVNVVGPDSSTDTDQAGDDWTVTTTTLIKSKAGTGSWSLSAECELCEEWDTDTIPSGTGSDATGYNPDPPHDRYRRVFWRTKSGGAWSVSCSINAASASVSGTFASATELPYPDTGSASAAATAEGSNTTSESGTASTECNYRTATITTGASATSGGASASATGTTASATAATDGDGGSYSSASWTAAVPFAWSLDAQLRAMEAAYPDSIILRREGHGTTVDTSAVTTGAYSTSDTDRYETCTASATSESNVTVTDTDGIPSTFGPISLSIKSSSASANQEPTTDLRILMHAREMAGITLSYPASVNVTAGTDSSLGGSPWGRTRSWAAVGPGWVGMMGWRYLSVPVTTASGTGSQSATVRIGSKTWTQDYTGATLTTGTSGGAAVTWVIDLCSPDSSTATDDTDTTYPYNGDWDVSGGDEDDYYRTGEGVYSGIMRAVSLSVEVGASASLTLGTFTLTRTDTNDALVTVLPPHVAWVEARPSRVVSEADTTTEYFARQTFVVPTEARLLSLEWTDTDWNRTTGGTSGVVTHTVTRHPLTWLQDRINNNGLSLGWSVTMDAPAVAGSGVAVWYNRAREVHDLLGGGYWFEPFSVSYPTGRWRSGIDFVAVGKPGGVLTSYGLKHQCRYYRLLACPGDVGDIDFHLSTDTTGATPLKASKILRCQGEGMSLDTSGVASSGDTVELTQTTSRGTGTTDTYGYGQTGSDYGFGAGGDVTVTLGGQSGSYPARARKRLHFRAKPVTDSGSGLCLALSPSLRLARSYVSGGTLWIGFATLPHGFGWSDADTGVSTTAAAIAYRSQVLVVDYADSGAIKRMETTTEGSSFGVATTIFSTGKNPALCVSPTFAEYHFCTASGAIKTKVLDATGTTMIAETTVVASGVDDDSISAAWRNGYIILTYAASGVITTVRSIDGTNYT